MNPTEQIEILRQGVETIISEEELRQKLDQKRPLRVKFGVDPTSPDIHLGHTVPLFKLRQFQDLGHQAILVIGDFTARIGDPSGRKTTRPQLDPTTIQTNAKTYEIQAFKILDPEKTEIVWNHHWFSKMTFENVMRLLARRPIAQILQRRDFKERMEANQPIQMHELTYPLLQGWDSVVVRADVELGGSDQLFNLLMGRDLQQQENQPLQIVMTLPILEGTDGVEKMSKSLNNYIGVTDLPLEMFGKCMSISDELMLRWYQILSGSQPSADLHPMEAKKQLATTLVSRFHSTHEAQQTKQQWEAQFSKHEIPMDIPSYQLMPNQPLWELLKQSGLASSGAEARRMIRQGAVSLDGNKLSDEHQVLNQPGVIKYGKRAFVRLTG